MQFPMTWYQVICKEVYIFIHTNINTHTYQKTRYLIKRINKTAVQINAKMFPIYIQKQHGLEQTYIQLIKMVSRQIRAKVII